MEREVAVGTGISLFVRTVTIGTVDVLRGALRSDTIALIVLLTGLLGMLFAVVWWDSWDSGDDTASVDATR
jgi:hypothetical protein